MLLLQEKGSYKERLPEAKADKESHRATTIPRTRQPVNECKVHEGQGAHST